MLCKKCGAKIADTSKFCGYCGEPNNVTNNIPQENNVVNVQSTFNESDLGNTIRIEPVKSDFQSIDIDSVSSENNEFVEPSSLDILIQTSSSQESQTLNNELMDIDLKQINVDVPTNSNEQITFETSLPNMPEIDPNSIQKSTSKEKKPNKLVWIFLAIALGIILLVVVSIAITNSSLNLKNDYNDFDTKNDIEEVTMIEAKELISKYL